jgi:hypothetical protein
MIYQYYIRPLLHFTRKYLMNLPFYLFRSIGKMADRVRAKSKDVETSVFHSGLIRMLVMEELKKINIVLFFLSLCEQHLVVKGTYK